MFKHEQAWKWTISEKIIAGSGDDTSGIRRSTGTGGVVSSRPFISILIHEFSPPYRTRLGLAHVFAMTCATDEHKHQFGDDD